jgi:hypothetical protein
MIEDIAMAVSTGAAGNIVAYMLNGRVDALRAKVTKIGTGSQSVTTTTEI